VDVLQGIADLDGDGHMSMVVTGSQGIGIMQHDGSNWQVRMVAPRDTKFWFYQSGGANWMYNATANTGYDQIQGFGDFLGSGKDQILVKSNWGLGVLSWDGTTFWSRILHPNPNWFGDWQLDTNSQTIIGIGDMNGGSEEVLIKSSSKLGLLTFAATGSYYRSGAGNTFVSLLVKNTGTIFGSLMLDIAWVLDTVNDVFHGLHDFDGDGKKELLISSSGAIGILKFYSGPSGNTFTPIAKHVNGANLNGFIVNMASVEVVAVGNIAGDGKERIIVMDAAGAHVLKWQSNALTRESFWAQGALSNGWLLDTADTILGPFGDFDNDGSSELVIQNSSGVGVLSYSIAGGLICETLHEFGSSLGLDWKAHAMDKFVASGNLIQSISGQQLLVESIQPSVVPAGPPISMATPTPPPTMDCGPDIFGFYYC